MCMGCCAKGGSSGPMQHVWKEGGCELNPLRNMWLLGAWAMFGSARNLAREAQGFCPKCAEVEAADEFHFEDVK